MSEQFISAVTSALHVQSAVEALTLSDYSIFAYEGYNPCLLVGAFAQVLLDTDQAAPEKANNIIMECVMIGLMHARLERASVAGKKRIEELAKLFSIPLRKKASRRSITFTRCVNMFPLHASLAVYKCPSLTRKTQLSGKFGSSDCPDMLCHTGAASVVPRGDVGELILLCHIGYMLEVGDLIDPKAKEKDTKTRFKEQARFAKLAWNSRLIDNTDRIAAFLAYGMLDPKMVGSYVKSANAVLKAAGLDLITAESFPIKDNRVVISESEDELKSTDEKAVKMSPSFKTETTKGGKTPDGSTSLAASTSSQDCGLNKD